MPRIHTQFSFLGVILAAALLSGCARLHLEEGQAAYQELRYQDAIHHFGKAVTRTPEPEAYRMLAGAHARVNEHEEAASAYSVLVALPEATDDDRLSYSAALFKEGGRTDLMEKEDQEMLVLQVYLPKQVSEEVLRKRIQEVIAETGAEGMKDFGRIMKVLVPEFKGKADNALIKDLAGEFLN